MAFQLKIVIQMVFTVILYLTALTTVCANIEIEQPNGISIEAESLQTGSTHTDTESDNVKKGFVSAFLASLGVIIVTEIGDKTFFIAAIMSMQNPKWTVFGGAFTALLIMTLLSTILGATAASLIPKDVTLYLSVILFAVFGCKMLYEGVLMQSDSAQEEYEEAKEEIAAKHSDITKSMLIPEVGDVEANVDETDQGAAMTWKMRLFRILSKTCSVIFIEALTLTFLGEWGDRSQMATIVLSSSNDFWGVNIGGILGHCLCTGLACVGGSLIATKISAKAVTITGGVVFLLFAFLGLVMSAD